MIRAITFYVMAGFGLSIGPTLMAHMSGGDPLKTCVLFTAAFTVGALFNALWEPA